MKKKLYIDARQIVIVLREFERKMGRVHTEVHILILAKNTRIFWDKCSQIHKLQNLR